MTRMHSRLTGLLTCASVLIAGAGSPMTTNAADMPLNTGRIEQLTGVTGQLNVQEGVFKVSVPRTDLTVTVAGVTVTPPMGLTSYAAFMRAGDQVMIMGDTVLLEDQVNPVMDVALANGLEVTALHNHFFWDTPKVMFMHIGGKGDLEKLASAVGKVFAKIKETGSGTGLGPQASLDPQRTSLDPKRVDAILGAKGEMANGVYKATFGRTTRMDGHEVGNVMGVNTWAAFVGSDSKAAVDGDFVMLEQELQPVLKALRHAGINIVAIHNHMEMEAPRVVFLHYWGTGSTADLAKGLRAALDTQKK